ncbi:splicing factor 3B subunit 2 [Sitodiplosis mosellana]|uniref:splicing factor 3B subunit 2 n=1 Tax=Sitodiplosis mosellana TaxID=263140 RepID=UPI002443CDD1|nr:splicing factor 3B subunit 2 [Sitodiplosis mosellana]
MEDLNHEQHQIHSMAEHEAEMQRQMMSVPATGTQMMNTLPPGMPMSNINQNIMQQNNMVPPPPIGIPIMHNTNEINQPPPFNQLSGEQSNWGTDETDKSAHNLPPPPLMSVKVDKPDEVKGNQQNPSEVVLPKALEDVFAFKDQLADELGRGDGEIPIETDKTASRPLTGVISTDYADADAESDEDDELPSTTSSAKSKGQHRLDKNKKKKQRKKQNKKNRQNKPQQTGDEKITNGEEKSSGKSSKNSESTDDVAIEYVPEKITVADLAPMYRQFYRVFELFKLDEKPAASKTEETTETTEDTQKKDKDHLLDDDDEDMDDDKKDANGEKLSKRKLKKLTRLSVAELKQLVGRPDVVEMHDVTARDPKLLVQLKAHRNTVQVPRHWCFKRKYLQGKRGIEKPPFDLPAFIKKTGIMEMRASLQEKDEAKTLKAKMRERTRPKMGKIDIDYQKLHDAFFKWQTKPRMTIHGDLYYEGKEFETRLKEKKPGDLSEELRTALGMPIGPNCHKIPPPWLIAQQRYGPPPSYPNLKIPGLNAPIPEGCSFGYHAGGWGKPPVDEKGKPLYGDVFGTSSLDADSGVEEGDIDHNIWGELESESEESSEEEEEDENEDIDAPLDESGLVTPAEGMVTPSGLTSVTAGMETPDTIELRKKKIESEMEDNETPVLYQVLPEKRGERIGASMMGSTHVYDMSTATGAKPPQNIAGAHRVGDREGMVELALDPSELDLDNDAMAQRYEQQMREQQSHLQKEDLSDMLAEHVAKQKSKRKRQQGSETTSKQTKKYKEFKF